MLNFILKGADLTIQSAFVVSLLIAIVVLAGYLEWSITRGRLMKRKSVKMAVAKSRDDAYNASVTTRAIARNMKAAGYDVSRAEIMLARAEQELGEGNFSEARRISDESRSMLLEMKNSGMTKIVQRAAVPATEHPVRRERLPKNMAEASFTIKDAENELNAQLSSGNSVDEAVERLAAAKELFRQRRYEEALSAAFKVKQMLNRGSENIHTSAPDKRKEETANAERGRVCPSCGSAAREQDHFCRKCGKEFSRQCSSCGETLMEGDLFCGRCGIRAETH